MNDFEKMMTKFDLTIATENEKLMYYAIDALVTIVEKQGDQIKLLIEDVKFLDNHSMRIN